MKNLIVTLCVSAAAISGCAAPTEDVLSEQSDLARAATVAASGEITDRVTFKPLAGAAICVVGNTMLACATTGTDGKYTIQVPSGTDVALSLKLTTHVDTYLTFTTAAAPVNLGPLRVMDKAFDATFAQQAGGVRDQMTGELVVAVFDQFPNPGGVATGAELEISGGGGRLFYTDESGVPSSALTSTSSRGVGGYVNVRPGPVSLWVNHASLQCAGAVAWSAAGAGAMRTQVFAGGTTVVYTTCAP